jgi:glycerol uptake facilitator protein
MLTSKRMTANKVPVYLLAQFLGALLAGLGIFLMFEPSILSFEKTHQIIRGTSDSMATAKMFGEFYNQLGATSEVSMPLAMAAEGFGTFLLVLMIFSLTEGCNLGKPQDHLAPVFIGLTVTSIICLLAPLTQAGLNPARDFGPRLIAWIFGWGSAAFPDQSGGFFFVYILSPILGGQAAGFFFTKLLAPVMNKPQERCCCNSEQA